MSALPEVSQASFQSDVLDAATPVLVDFWAPWCGPCRMLAPEVEKVAGEMAGRVKVVKLNTDENPVIAGQYHISGIPCLVLFKGGKEVGRIVGFVHKSKITDLIAPHLSPAA